MIKVNYPSPPALLPHQWLPSKLFSVFFGSQVLLPPLTTPFLLKTCHWAKQYFSNQTVDQPEGFAHSVTACRKATLACLESRRPLTPQPSPPRKTFSQTSCRLLFTTPPTHRWVSRSQRPRQSKKSQSLCSWHSVESPTVRSARGRSWTESRSRNFARPLSERPKCSDLTSQRWRGEVNMVSSSSTRSSIARATFTRSTQAAKESGWRRDAEGRGRTWDTFKGISQIISQWSINQLPTNQWINVISKNWLSVNQWINKSMISQWIN